MYQWLNAQYQAVLCSGQRMGKWKDQFHVRHQDILCLNINLDRKDSINRNIWMPSFLQIKKKQLKECDKHTFYGKG